MAGACAESEIVHETLHKVRLAADPIAWDVEKGLLLSFSSLWSQLHYTCQRALTWLVCCRSGAGLLRLPQQVLCQLDDLRQAVAELLVLLIAGVQLQELLHLGTER